MNRINELMNCEAEMTDLLLIHGINNPRCGAHIGVGWFPHVKKLIETLVSMGWDKELHQIKEKFGSMRFYTGSVTPEMQELITSYENMTFKMCEVCGEEGKISGHGGYWAKCLCPEHAAMLQPKP
jgi:hypothetical protein